jgi:hypothetical protein
MATTVNATTNHVCAFFVMCFLLLGFRFVKRCLPVQAMGNHFSSGSDTICGSRMQNAATQVSNDADQKTFLK